MYCHQLQVLSKKYTADVFWLFVYLLIFGIALTFYFTFLTDSTSRGALSLCSGILYIVISFFRPIFTCANVRKWAPRWCCCRGQSRYLMDEVRSAEARVQAGGDGEQAARAELVAVKALLRNEREKLNQALASESNRRGNATASAQSTSGAVAVTQVSLMTPIPQREPTTSNRQYVYTFPLCTWPADKSFTSIQPFLILDCNITCDYI